MTGWPIAEASGYRWSGLEKRCGIAHGCRVGVIGLENLGLTVDRGSSAVEGFGGCVWINYESRD